MIYSQLLTMLLLEESTCIDTTSQQLQKKQLSCQRQKQETLLLQTNCVTCCVSQNLVNCRNDKSTTNPSNEVIRGLDRETDDDSKYRASIASRGKKSSRKIKND